MADTFAGKHNSGDSDPTVKRGPGVEAAATPEFIGGHPGDADPTFTGYVKKRPVLGDTTVLTQVKP